MNTTATHPLDINYVTLGKFLDGEDTPEKLAFIEDMLPLAIKTFQEEDFSLATMNAELIIRAKFPSAPEATSEDVLRSIPANVAQAA